MDSQVPQTNKYLMPVIVILIIAGGVYYFSQKNDSTEETVSNEPVAEEQTVQIKDCGADLSCGNNLLANCTSGNFKAQGGALEVTTTINGPSGGGCEVNSSVTLASLTGLADPSLDKNNDGILDMTCNVRNVLDFDGLTQYLKANLEKCTGELKDFYDTMGE